MAYAAGAGRAVHALGTGAGEGLHAAGKALPALLAAK